MYGYLRMKVQKELYVNLSLGSADIGNLNTPLKNTVCTGVLCHLKLGRQWVNWMAILNYFASERLITQSATLRVPTAIRLETLIIAHALTLTEHLSRSSRAKYVNSQPKLIAFILQTRFCKRLDLSKCFYKYCLE
ncbi:hypothetical protein WN51_00278 [Melipona quadrifasciata]|uniref:Uncharacterized protein n=1 Tax=Melipona quadrifasciata TaxID=166423 RepID=A0A0M8ZZN2_9HYME|nr:hypothetical protein WN51_00278 [Melipona quadrifasciata]